MKRTIKKYPKTFLSFLIVLFLLSVIYVLPYIINVNPYEQHLERANQAPNFNHLMGTDIYGRDLLNRILYGGQNTITSTIILSLITVSIGSTLGLYSGYYNNWLSKIILRTVDVFLAFPGLIFAIAIASVLNQGMAGAILALSLISWPKYTRLVRGSVLVQREQAYIEAAIMSGTSDFKIIFRHILPNIVRPILVTSILDVGTFLMELSSLSFLGLGAQLPTIEWGAMMNDGKKYFQTAPWLILGPGIVIVMFVASIHLLGDSINDEMNVRREGE